MKPLHIATSNDDKYQELSLALQGHFDCQKTPLDLVEIQGDSQQIITHKLTQAYQVVGSPVLVDDVAVCIDALGGFPGPYIKGLLQTLGAQGIADLFAGSNVRGECFLGIMFDTHNSLVVSATIDGTITQPKGDHRFGFDPIFLPNGCDKTFAEMSTEEKNTLSHRSKAIKKLLCSLDKTHLDSV